MKPTRLDRLTRLARPLCLGASVMLVIFGTYELIERTWLLDFEMDFLHRLHIGRGIFSSIAVALVVGWMIQKTSPGFFLAPPGESGRVHQPRLSEEQRTEIYARWFISLRWIAVLVAGLLIVSGVKMFHWLPEEVWWPLVGLVAALGGCNLLFTFLIRWRRGGPVMLGLQGYIDLMILTGLLHFSGGVENPLSVVMLFHVIIGGILLSRGQCYGMATAGTLLFGWLVWAEMTGIWPHYTLAIFPHFEEHGHPVHAAHQPLFVVSRVVLHGAILYLTAYFVTTLAERMRYNERRLETMAGQALAERQLLEQSLETTGAGLRLLDRQLNPYWASSRWKEWFLSSMGPPGCAPLDQSDSPARHCLADGQIRRTELVLPQSGANAPSPQAGQRVFQITTAPLPVADGQISKVVELAQDVTEQKQTQSRMLHAGKLAAVGELAGQVAHEVNNPVAIIHAKTNLLLLNHQSEMSPKVALELGKILDLARRVADIAQGLLSSCRPSAGTRVLLDIRLPIRKSLAMIEEHARRCGVRVEEQFPAQPSLIHANPQELEQVFLNLFLNALDAMPKGGWLTISTCSDWLDSTAPEPSKPALTVRVDDTGTGIPDSIRDRVFEPFFTTKKEGRGTGLGLSICLGLVRSHGGEIAHESKLWRGTRVSVKFPLASRSQSNKETHG